MGVDVGCYPPTIDGMGDRSALKERLQKDEEKKKQKSFIQNEFLLHNFDALWCISSVWITFACHLLLLPSLLS